MPSSKRKRQRLSLNGGLIAVLISLLFILGACEDFSLPIQPITVDSEEVTDSDAGSESETEEDAEDAGNDDDMSDDSEDADSDDESHPDDEDSEDHHGDTDGDDDADSDEGMDDEADGDMSEESDDADSDEGMDDDADDDMGDESDDADSDEGMEDEADGDMGEESDDADSDEGMDDEADGDMSEESDDADSDEGMDDEADNDMGEESDDADSDEGMDDEADGDMSEESDDADSDEGMDDEADGDMSEESDDADSDEGMDDEADDDMSEESDDADSDEGMDDESDDGMNEESDDADSDEGMDDDADDEDSGIKESDEYSGSMLACQDEEHAATDDAEKEEADSDETSDEDSGNEEMDEVDEEEILEDVKEKAANTALGETLANLLSQIVIRQDEDESADAESKTDESAEEEESSVEESEATEEEAAEVEDSSDGEGEAEPDITDEDGTTEESVSEESVSEENDASNDGQAEAAEDDAVAEDAESDDAGTDVADEEAGEEESEAESESETEGNGAAETADENVAESEAASTDAGVEEEARADQPTLGETLAGWFALVVIQPEGEDVTEEDVTEEDVTEEDVTEEDVTEEDTSDTESASEGAVEGETTDSDETADEEPVEDDSTVEAENDDEAESGEAATAQPTLGETLAGWFSLVVIQSEDEDKTADDSTSDSTAKEQADSDDTGSDESADTDGEVEEPTATPTDATHPLDGLTAQEHQILVDVLVAEGKVEAEKALVYAGLEEPDKELVLAWDSGDEIPRAAKILVASGDEVSAAVVDLVNRSLVSWRVVEGMAMPEVEAEESDESDETDEAMPAGLPDAAYKFDNGNVTWHNWSFHHRFDQLAGLVLSEVNYLNRGRLRSVLYQMQLAKIVGPDSGEKVKPFGAMLEVGIDCPDSATYGGALLNDMNGQLQMAGSVVCLFEADAGSYLGEPATELVVRTASATANHRYLVDYIFGQDGTIQGRVTLTGFDDAEFAQGDADEDGTGTMVAPYLAVVNQDHYFHFRLDIDVDGVQNNFVQSVLTDAGDGSWAVESTVAETKEDSLSQMNSETPTMYQVVNPNAYSGLGHSPAYMVIETNGNVSLADSRLWATAYEGGDKGGTEGDSIANTDIVVWYEMGFHHLPRMEDWPTKPMYWQGFQLVPFNFFELNPSVGE